ATSDDGRAHGAMVAPGYDGCGEPCKCGGNRSRHTIAGGLACDLTKQKMLDLEVTLAAGAVKGITAVNNYLKAVGLWRPHGLGPNPTGSDEAWHVEPTTP